MTSPAGFMSAASCAAQGASAGVVPHIPQHHCTMHAATGMGDILPTGSEDYLLKRPRTLSDAGAGECVSSRLRSMTGASLAPQAERDGRSRRFSVCESMSSEMVVNRSRIRQRRVSCGSSFPPSTSESAASNLPLTGKPVERLFSSSSSEKKKWQKTAGLMRPPSHALASMSNGLRRQLGEEDLAKTKCGVLARDRDILTVNLDSDLLRVPDNTASLPLRLAYEASTEKAMNGNPSLSVVSSGAAGISERVLDTEQALVGEGDSEGNEMVENGKPISTGEENREAAGVVVLESGKEPGKNILWEKLKKGLGPILLISPRNRGLLLFNLLSMLWGSNIVVVKEYTDAIDPAAFCALRFTIAALAFSPWIWNGLANKATRQAGIELGLWGGGAYLALAIGLVTTDAARASFISIFSVIVVPIISGMFGAKIPKVTWFSAAAAIAGVGLLEASGPGSLTGDLWTIGSALLFGVLMLRQEHFSRSLPNDKDYGKDGALSVIGLQLVMYAISSSIWAAVSHVSAGDSGILGELAVGDWSGIEHTVANIPWFATIYTGIFSTALCLWIEITAMCDITATEAAMVYTLEPVWGAAFAWILLGERWGPQGWVGAGLIIGGSAAMQIFGKAPEAEPLEVEAGAVIPLLIKSTSADASNLLNGAPTTTISQNGSPVKVAGDFPVGGNNGSAVPVSEDERATHNSQ